MKQPWMWVASTASMCVPLAVAGPHSVSPPVQASAATPFAACSTEGQPGVVFPGSKVEPSGDVNPVNALNIVIGYQVDRWSNGGARGLAASVTFDGGLTWSQVVIPKISACAGGTPANGGHFERATDPWVSFSPNGDVYFFSMVFDATTPPGSPGGSGKSAMVVSKSTDGGLSWSDPVKLIEDTDPRLLNDKNTLTADPGDSRFVYAVWDRLRSPKGVVINPENVFGLGFKGPAMFARSVDGGLSWEPARSIYDPAANNQTIGNQVVVLPDGTLVNLFNEILNFKNDDGGAQFEFNLSLVRSTDRGASWPRGPAIRAAKMQTMATRRASGVVDPDPQPGKTSRVRTADIIPAVAVNRQPGTPGYGHLYAVWQDARFSHFSHDEIAFARSSDGGLTWSAPIKVNRTPVHLSAGSRQAFTPSVRVAADGTIAVSYYDFRHHVAGSPALATDHWIVHCHPSAAVTCTRSEDWTSEARVTPVSFDMRAAPDARGYFLGDYMALVAIGNRFRPVFIQSGPAQGSAEAFVAEAAEP